MNNTSKKRVLIFASGSKDGGGSGFENLVRKSRETDLGFEVVAVISNHENGGVRQKADKLEIPFVHFEKPYTSERYLELVNNWSPDLISLSGWLKLCHGLPPQRTINIHPGLLPEFGGDGMYGHFVHEAVMKAYKEGRVLTSGLSMHFVTEKYDEGPVFFRCEVPIFPDDTPESLAKRVNEAEHKWQPEITGKVARGEIFWDGVTPESLNTTISV